MTLSKNSADKDREGGNDFWTVRFSRKSKIGQKSPEDFLARQYRMKCYRLKELLQRAGESEEGFEEMLSLDSERADWSDLYALELAIIKVLPEEQLALELANLRKRFVEVVGTAPEQFVSPQAETKKVEAKQVVAQPLARAPDPDGFRGEGI